MGPAVISWIVEGLGPGPCQAEHVYLDEAAECLIAYHGSAVSAYALPWHHAYGTAGAQPLWTVQTPEGVNAPLGGHVALSIPLPGVPAATEPAVLATLQDSRVVHLLDTATGTSFVQAAQPLGATLLGFFWTTFPQARFVTVAAAGVTFFELRTQALHETKACKEMASSANMELGPVLWHKYQHHSRILLLGTALDLVVMQITSQRGVTRLRNFHLSTFFHGAPVPSPATLGASMAIARQITDGTLGGQTTRVFVCVCGTSLPDIQVLSLSSAEVTHIAALQKPKSSGWEQIPAEFGAEDVRYSMLDNLLFVHFLPTGVVAGYDLTACCDAMPMQRQVLTVPPAISFRYATLDQDGASSSTATFPPGDAVYVPPCHAVDISRAQAFRMKVDVRRVIEETPLVGAYRLRFLFERDASLWPWLGTEQARQLRLWLQSQPPLSFARRLFDELNTKARRINRLGGAARPRARVLQPIDVCNDVLGPLKDEAALPADYLQALAAVFCVSAEIQGHLLPPDLDILLYDLMRCQGDGFQGDLMLRGMGKTIASDMVAHVAMHTKSLNIMHMAARLWGAIFVSNHPIRQSSLTSSPTSAAGPPNAGLDALRIEALQGYCRCSLAAGDVVGAARGVRAAAGPVRTEASHQVLEAASDRLLFAPVYRYCESLRGRPPGRRVREYRAA